MIAWGQRVASSAPATGTIRRHSRGTLPPTPRATAGAIPGKTKEAA